MKGPSVIDSLGSALRLLRQQHGLSLAALGQRTFASKSTLGNIETGTFRPSLALVQALDRSLDSAPLLETLFQIERGEDDVKRRALLGTFGAAAGALLATADGTAALASVLDHGLRDAIAEPVDWDALAADFSRRHVLAPSKALGDELAAQLAMARPRVVAGDRDAARGAAALALTYGLWLGDTGRVSTAAGLYATSAKLADHSTDTHTRALVRARAASRGPYEGWTAKRVAAGITEALAITTRGPAALEAHGAAVHLAALTGDLPGGLRALAAMRAVADTIDDTGDGPSAHQRVVSFDMYLHGRIGRTADAQRAYSVALVELASVPLWHTDATLYMSRALIRAGDVATGVTMALTAAKGAPSAVRVLGLGVRDVLAAVPAGHHGATVEQLRGYASTGPAPWDTLKA